MSGPIAVIAWSFTRAQNGYLCVYRVITFDGYLVVGQTSMVGQDGMEYMLSSRKTPEAAQREAVRFTETMEQEGFEIDAWPMRLVPSLLPKARFLWLGHPRVADMKDRDWDDLWGAVITHGDDLEGRAMKDNPAAIAWELRTPDGSATLIRRVMLICEYVIIGEMYRTSDVRHMEYHVTYCYTEENARVEAVRCTEMAEKQGYKMYLQPRYTTMNYDAETMVDYLTFKANLEDRRGTLAPIFDTIKVSGKMVGR